MRALVVTAHPCADSFAHAAAERAVAGLEAAGHHVDTIDLAASGFIAAMSLDERRAYHSDRPVIDPHVAEHVALIRAATILVLVYPTWWSGLPAILKGWLERTLVPGVGFRFDESTGKVRPGLTHIRRIVGVSTYGSPWFAVKIVNDNGRRTITRALRLSCGVRARTTWLGLYGMDTATPADRIAFLARVEQRMARLT
ncbi:MAG: NAD(P)H-dependent oxidoreductase [Ilumatobacteraceae bacterium]